MSKPHVWVVEMKVKQKFFPCSDVAPTKRLAVFKVRVWENNNPDDQFRVAKYVRVEPTSKRRKRK